MLRVPAKFEWIPTSPVPVAYLPIALCARSPGAPQDCVDGQDDVHRPTVHRDIGYDRQGSGHEGNRARYTGPKGFEVKGGLGIALRVRGPRLGVVEGAGTVTELLWRFDSVSLIMVHCSAVRQSCRASGTRKEVAGKTKMGQNATSLDV